MLTIKEAADKRAVRSFLDSLGVSDSVSEDIVMCCEENGRILGVSSLALSEGKVYLNLLVMAENADEMSLKLGLAKALMNLADLRGIKKIYGSSKALENIYTALRFQKEEEEYSVSLEGYFTAGHAE